MLQSFDQDNGITSNDWHWLLDIQIPFPGDVCMCVTLELQVWYAISGFLYLNENVYILSSGPHGQIGISKNISVLEVIAVLLKK